MKGARNDVLKHPQLLKHCIYDLEGRVYRGHWRDCLATIPMALDIFIMLNNAVVDHESYSDMTYLLSRLYVKPF